MNSFNFCLSRNSLSLLFYMMILLNRVFWVTSFFSFQNFEYIMPLPSGLQSFWREMSRPLYGHSLISDSFSPVAFRILALCLIFAILSTVCLYVGSVWLHLVWDPLCLLYLNVCLLLHIWSLLAIISSNTFSISSLFLLFLGLP